MTGPEREVSDGPVVAGLWAVALGGALGAGTRQLLSVAWPFISGAVPWATLTANLGGCLLLGLLVGWFGLKPSVDRRIRLLLTAGFCGALTTMSTFVVEVLLMLGDGYHRLAVVYAVVSVVGGVMVLRIGVGLIGGPVPTRR